MSIDHIKTVRFLYKTILRLHRGLPEELKLLGTSYVKDEFQRHKNCDPVTAAVFLKKWAEYATVLTKQMGLRGPKTAKTIGENVDERTLQSLREEQIVQLYELMKAAKSIKD